MIDLVKKTLLAGVGAAVVTKEKIETAVEDLVRQGKVSAADARIMADKITEQGRREFDTLADQLGTRIKELVAQVDRESVKRITELETRVAVLEHKLAQTPTRAEEP